MAESHIRIDEGIKRGPRKAKTIPKAALSGMFISPHSPELRQTVTQRAPELLAAGLTTNEIGAQYGIPGRTIRYWLINDDNAEQARKSMVDQELTRTGEEIRAATEPLPLARAREEARYWMWIAERRDSQRYGQKQELTVKAEIKMEGVLDSLSQSILERIRTIDVTPVPVLPQLEDKDA